MNSLPSDNRENINAILVKSHQPIANYPFPDKNQYLTFKKIFKHNYSIKNLNFTKNIFVSGKAEQVRGGDSVFLGEHQLCQ